MSLKRLLLQLLSALPPTEPSLAVAALVRAGALFGFEAGAVRVALSRLQAAGHVEGVGRGSWRLTPSAARLAGRVSAWRVPSDESPWNGGWVGVATGGLGRVDRTAVKRRDRALSLHGFRELRPGLSLRPDNCGSIDDLRGALVSLGLASEAPVFEMSPLGPSQPDAIALWDVEALVSGYRAARAELTAVQAKLASWPVDRAAREAFAAGSAVLRLLTFDPRLPAAMMDPAEREALVAAMIAFDDDARGRWQQILQSEAVLEGVSA